MNRVCHASSKFVLAFGLAVISLLPIDRAHAKGDELIYSFCSQANCADGSFPGYGPFIKDKVGNLYGTTTDGGAYGNGTVYKLSPSNGAWTEIVLHSFCANGYPNCPDGYNVIEGVTMDKSGNLYGTTQYGGSCAYHSVGCGVVYELSPDGTETVLYSFTGGSDGGIPRSNLIIDKAGDIYGTTFSGGIQNSCLGGDSGSCGVIFKIVPNGTNSTETVLYAFQGGSDASQPQDDLIMDKAGNLYGTGNGGACSANGTVWEASPQQNGGWTETVLHSFGCERSDGTSPYGGVSMDESGNLYGTAYYGGFYSKACYFGCGNVFKIVPDGVNSTETVLFDFNNIDGANPVSSPIIDKAGNLYGTTTFGGVHGDVAGYGVIYKLAPDGTERVIHNFNKSSGDGRAGNNKLLKDGDGDLYGVTLRGGVSDWGTIFEIKK